MEKTLLLKNVLSAIFILLLINSVLAAQEIATVLKIIDGDTLKLNYNGKEENIRLIGIDTPESSKNKKA